MKARQPGNKNFPHRLWHVTYMKKCGIDEETDGLGEPRAYVMSDNIKIELQEMRCEGVDGF